MKAVRFSGAVCSLARFQSIEYAGAFYQPRGNITTVTVTAPKASGAESHRRAEGGLKTVENALACRRRTGISITSELFRLQGGQDAGQDGRSGVLPPQNNRHCAAPSKVAGVPRGYE